MITKEMIDNRIENFLGYGNLNSEIWFIGMEEGFNGDEQDLGNRFSSTKDKSIIDLQGMPCVKDHLKWFQPDSPIQKTWRKLILILLVLRSENNIDDKKIKQFQIEKLGRKESNHCILELMPLPCGSTKPTDWKKIYTKFGDKLGIDYLKSRQYYLDKVRPNRIEKFKGLVKGLVDKHSPKTIICYGLTYLKEWEEIIGPGRKEKEIEIGKRKLYFYKNDKTNFFVIPHPCAWGLTNNDWLGIASEIKQNRDSF